MSNRGTELYRDWESEDAYEAYDQGDVEWDGQYSSGRKRPVHDAVAIDIDSFARRPRKPRFESRDEVNQRMLSVKRAVRKTLVAKGERNFTDQEYPPVDRSLFVDPLNPPLRLQVVSLPMFYTSQSLESYKGREPSNVLHISTSSMFACPLGIKIGNIIVSGLIYTSDGIMGCKQSGIGLYLFLSLSFFHPFV